MSDPDFTSPACTLGADDLQRRRWDWKSVIDDALQARSAIPGGARMAFRPDHLTAHALLDLVAAERSCCGWASWALTSDAEGTVVTVTADGDGASVVQQMFEIEA
jgi:hypothetical protein